MTCLSSADGSIHICRPNGEYKIVPRKRRKQFWCFKCRKHLMHTLMRFHHVQPSYYDDWLKWECPQCHEENVLFPGWVWKYGDE